jgi:ribonuclease HI
VWVTCYTDASYSDDAGGAWAVWLRCDRGRLVRSGLCPPYVREANAAELAAIFAGLHLAVTTWGSRVDGVSLRSDSKVALGHADPESKLSRNSALRRLQERVRSLLREHDLELDCRWVRGHQRVEAGTHAFLNDRCDRLAKRARKAVQRRRRRERGEARRRKKKRRRRRR